MLKTVTPSEEELIEQYKNTGRWGDHLFSNEELEQIRVENKLVLDEIISPRADNKQEP